MNHPWLYDETVQAGTDYQDEDQVRAYDARMGRLRHIEAEIGEIRAALGVSAGSVLWEIGTGTGECALGLAAWAGHVYATDTSRAMLAYARQKAASRGVANLTFEWGGFLSGFRPGKPVDGIVSQLAFHHLPDFWKARALEEMAAALRPGGRLFLRDVIYPSLASGKEYDDFFRAVIEGVRAKAGEEMAAPTIRHIKAEFSTLDWILEGMIERSGLKIREKSAGGLLSMYVCEK
ncbi:MAG: class I SAM-dependent methyltransferase [Desulfobacteraceae bacterium]|nr:class I SAM-dependent methyltransferase [Desulfobacteraceae bacterium]